MTPAARVTITVPPERAADMRKALLVAHASAVHDIHVVALEDATPEEEFERFMRHRAWLLQLDTEVDRLGWWQETTSSGDVSVTLDADRVEDIADRQLDIGEVFDAASADEKRRLLTSADWWLGVQERAEAALPREEVAA